MTCQTMNRAMQKSRLIPASILLMVILLVILPISKTLKGMLEMKKKLK